MWQNWTNLTLGVWLVTEAFIPAVTASHNASTWNNSLVGGIAVLIGVLVAAGNKQTVCWVNAVIGAWLLVSAFIPIIAGQISFWNDISAGALIIAVSTWAIIRVGSGTVAHS